MNSLQKFEFGDVGVEVIIYKNEPLFNSRDIGACLGICDVTIRRHIQDMDCEEVVKLTNQMVCSSNVHQVNTRKINNAGENFLTESGVFALLIKSSKPEAVKFQKWVTKEVLPSIRKTGQYKISNINNSVDIAIPEELAIRRLKVELDASSLFKVPEHIAQVEAVKTVDRIHNVDFSSHLLNAPAQNQIKEEEKMLEPTEIGKLIGLSAMKTNLFLHYIEWQNKKGIQWIPTEEGKLHSSNHAWKVSSKSGYNLKWNVNDVLEAWNSIKSKKN